MTEIKQKRMTKQRKVIMDILKNTDIHPTADWIYAEAKKVVPDISLATVYRNLQVLVNEHTILELNYGKGYSRFDGDVQPHYHFICQHCGQVLDVHNTEMLDVNLFAGNIGGTINGYRLEFYGVCKDCL